MYVDEIFLVNLIMDWLILWAVGNLAQTDTRSWRTGLAAMLGACYAVLVLLNRFMAALPVKLGWSLLMIAVAYPVINWRNYLKHTVYFYLISFVLGGASVAVMYVLGEPSAPAGSGIAMVQIDFQLFWLAIAAFLTGTAVCGLRGRLRQDLTAVQQMIPVTIQLNGQHCAVRLLVDSGHSVTDPLSGQAVLIVEQQALLSLFPTSLQHLLEAPGYTESERLLLLASQSGMTGRWRLIPYRAVGQQSMLLGFRPDAVVVEQGAVRQSWRQIIVALSPQTFSACHTYQGLFPPTLL